MFESDKQNITLLLEDCVNGKKEAINELLPLVYNELKKISSKYLHEEYRNHTLQTTELVHEAYIKLIGGQEINWQNRGHFFGIAANSMRQILVDYARKHNSQKRGEGKTHLSLENAEDIAFESEEDIIALDDAMKKLEAFDPDLSKVVELRFFGGLNVDETSKVLNCSASTVKRDWSLAKAWLFRELGKE
ncbi:MAG: sigma-70 family RNA polymerase sigma factor [Ignavibacteriales bacterium]|nr:sigma-70 family RNA polymerase sigma factor [Ignavibacteriales bacterium]